MSSKTDPRERRARVKPAEGRTMMEAPSLGISAPVLGAPITLLNEGVGRVGRTRTTENTSDSQSQMKRLSALNSEQIFEGGLLRDIADDGAELFINPVDMTVHAAVVDSDMSESQYLRAELDGMEARIVELRQDESGAYERLAEAQRDANDRTTARVTMEEVANIIRQRLGMREVSIVMQPTTVRPLGLKAVSAVPQRRIRHGTRRDQFRAVLEPLMIANGGTARRQAIRQAWLEAGLFEDVENIDSVLSGALHHLRNAGYIDTDYRGTWTWIGLR